MTKLIQIQDLHYRPDDLPQDHPDILQGIDLEVEEGALIALLGENGAGKPPSSSTSTGFCSLHRVFYG